MLSRASQTTATGSPLSARKLDLYNTTQNGGGYWSVYGTSFSTPQVAGLAALLFSLNPDLSNSQVVDIIKNNTDDLGAPGFDPYYGWGRINVYRALQAVQTTPPTSTSVAITSPPNGSLCPERSTSMLSQAQLPGLPRLSSILMVFLTAAC